MPTMLRVRQRRRDRPPQADLQGFIAEGVDLVGAVDKVWHGRIDWRPLAILGAVERMTMGGSSHAGAPIIA